MNHLLSQLYNKKIAIVSNAKVSRDYSSVIDAADVVIRFNNFYNYDSGLVGKKINIIIQTVCNTWFNSPIKHEEIIKNQLPFVYLIKKPEGYNVRTLSFYGDSIRVQPMFREFSKLASYTTGTALLKYLADNLNNAQVTCIGFQDDVSWNEYINSDASQYKINAAGERIMMLSSIEKLHSLKISDKAFTLNTDSIIIPIKRHSSGAPNKNRLLIKHCINKLIPLNLPIYIVGDDNKLLFDLIHDFDSSVICVSLPTIRPFDDITLTLRSWRDKMNFCGNIALVQCTSPHLDASWVKMCLGKLNSAVLAATCCDLGFKPTAIFAEESGFYCKWAKERPAASTARQLLPKTLRLTGAVFAFHSDTLDYDSFFDAGVLKPVMVDSKFTLDVDTKEDLEIALNSI